MCSNEICMTLLQQQQWLSENNIKWNMMCTFVIAYAFTYSQIYVHKCKFQWHVAEILPPPYHLVSHERALSHSVPHFVSSEWYVEAATCMYTSLNNFSCSIEFISFILFFCRCIYKYAVYVPTYIIYIICWIAAFHNKVSRYK